MRVNSKAQQNKGFKIVSEILGIKVEAQERRGGRKDVLLKQ